MADISAELEAKRTRLAAIERELSQLGARHEVAMSAFRFDEVLDLQRRIAVVLRGAFPRDWVDAIRPHAQVFRDQTAGEALRDAGHEIVNVACSLGRAAQVGRRRADLEEACRRAGFELVVLERPFVD